VVATASQTSTRKFRNIVEPAESDEWCRRETVAASESAVAGTRCTDGLLSTAIGGVLAFLIIAFSFE
jgi:hypothetical protein